MPKVLDPGTIRKWRTWKEKKKKEIAQKEEEVAKELQATVPENLRGWLEAGGTFVISRLLEPGQISRTYHHYETHQYGFTDLAEFAERFEGLKVAWADEVQIDLAWENDQRFRVTYTAL